MLSISMRTINNDAKNLCAIVGLNFQPIANIQNMTIKPTKVNVPSTVVYSIYAVFPT